MQLDFSAPIRDLDGKPVSDGGNELTLGKIVVNAMFAILPGDQGTSGEQKAKQYEIAKAANRSGMGSVSAEDVAIIKQRLAVLYNALVVGRAYEMIEGASMKPVNLTAQARN